jgi:hypothetical protein
MHSFYCLSISEPVRAGSTVIQNVARLLEGGSLNARDRIFDRYD